MFFHDLKNHVEHLKSTQKRCKMRHCHHCYPEKSLGPSSEVWPAARCVSPGTRSPKRSVTAARDGEDSPTERRRLMLILVRYGYDKDMIWIVNVSFFLFKTKTCITNWQILTNTWDYNQLWMIGGWATHLKHVLLRIVIVGLNMGKNNDSWNFQTKAYWSVDVGLNNVVQSSVGSVTNILFGSGTSAKRSTTIASVGDERKHILVKPPPSNQETRSYKWINNNKKGMDDGLESGDWSSNSYWVVVELTTAIINFGWRFYE